MTLTPYELAALWAAVRHRMTMLEFERHIKAAMELDRSEGEAYIRQHLTQTPNS